MAENKEIRVGLFVTCLVDLWRPAVGFAALRLLEDAGCRVEIPATQTCCGQPAFNGGATANARAIAQQVIQTFAAYEYVVVPSGSCASLLKIHYPGLFPDDDPWQARAFDLARRSFEMLEFLSDVLERAPRGRFPARAVYHDGCHGLRELGLKRQPRELLAGIEGLELRELAEPEACCGFGGTFCVKYPELSARLVDDKLRDIAATGADTLISGEMGCLLNLAGRLRRLGRPVRCFHALEVLAGMTTAPALGEDREPS